MLKKILIVLGALLVIAVGVVAYAATQLNAYLDANRGEFEKQASEALQRDVKIGGIELSILDGFGARVKNFAISEDPKFGEGNFLSAGNVLVSVRLWPLLSSKVEVAQVLLEEPKVRVVQRAGGFNFDSIAKSETPEGAPSGGADATAKPKREPAPEAGTSGEAEAGSPVAFLVALIEIRDADLRYIDERSESKADVAIDNLDFRVTNLSLDEPVGIEIAASLFGQGSENLRLKAQVGPVGALPPKVDTLPIDASIELGPIDVAAVRKALPGAIPAELDAPGALVLKVSAKGTPSKVRVTVDFDESDGKIAWADSFVKPAGVPLSLSLAADIAIDSGAKPATRIAIEKLLFRLAGLELAGKGKVTQASTTAIELQLDSNAAALSGWDRLLPALAGNDVSGTLEIHLAVDGRVGDPKAALPQVKGTIALAGVNAKQQDSPYEIEGLNAKIEMLGNGLKLPASTFRLGGSPITVEADVADFAKPVARFALRSDELRAASLAFADASARKEEIIRGLAVEGNLDTRGEHPKFDGKVRSLGGSLRNIDYGDLAVDLKLADQVARLSRLELGAFEGSYSGVGRYDMSKAEDPAFDFESTIRDMRVEKMLDSQFPAEEQQLTGLLDADLKVAGSGAGWDVIQKRLKGDGRLDVRKGILRDVNVAEGVLNGLTGIAGLSKLISERVRTKYPALFSSGDTEFEKLGGTVQIADGRATTNDLAIAARDYAVKGEGWFGFDQQVDFKASLVGSKQLTDDLIADVKEVKYLANDQGKLEVPFRLEGALATAKPKPDREFVATALKRAVADKVVEKGLDKLLGKPKEGETERPEKELLRKGIEGLFGR